MTIDTVNQIVKRVASRHPKFKPLRTDATSTAGKVAFREFDVDPRTVAGWFEKEGAYVIQIGNDCVNGCWFAYFRQKDTK